MSKRGFHFQIKRGTVRPNDYISHVFLELQAEMYAGKNLSEKIKNRIKEILSKDSFHSEAEEILSKQPIF